MLCEWGVVSVKSDSIVSEFFHGVSIGHFKTGESFCLLEVYAN